MLIHTGKEVSMAKKKASVKQATMTCPKCKCKQKRRIPKDMCSVKSYDCKECGKTNKDKGCCAFCAFSNKKCGC